MESKRKAEVLENEEKRPRREHTSLLQLLQQVEQHTMPTGTDYHVRHCPVTPFQQSRPYAVSGFQQLVELGSIRVDGRERDAEEVLEECVNTIDQTLKEIADVASLEKYAAGASTETVVAWMDAAMDSLMQRIDASLATP